jgi:hypothetical protein
MTTAFPFIHHSITMWRNGIVLQFFIGCIKILSTIFVGGLRSIFVFLVFSIEGSCFCRLNIFDLFLCKEIGMKFHIVRRPM